MPFPAEGRDILYLDAPATGRQCTWMDISSANWPTKSMGIAERKTLHRTLTKPTTNVFNTMTIADLSTGNIRNTSREKDEKATKAKM